MPSRRQPLGGIPGPRRTPGIDELLPGSDVGDVAHTQASSGLVAAVVARQAQLYPLNMRTPAEDAAVSKNVRVWQLRSVAVTWSPCGYRRSGFHSSGTCTSRTTTLSRYMPTQLESWAMLRRAPMSWSASPSSLGSLSSGMSVQSLSLMAYDRYPIGSRGNEEARRGQPV